MEKQSQNAANKSVPQQEKILQTIIREIVGVFANKKIYSTKDLGSLLKKITGWAKTVISSDPDTQAHCFTTISYILNNLCNQTNIKKFYNTAPSTSLREYSKKNHADQLLNNIYHNNRQRFYKDDIGWGNCHYRSVLFKNIFDLFQSQWLEIESKIVAHKNIWWHSFVLVTFQWQQYIVDVWWIDMISKKTVTPVDTLESSMRLALENHIKKDKQADAKVILYNDTAQFAEYIDTKPIKNISIQFKPKIEKGHISSDIDISINKKMVQITIDDTKYTLHIPEHYAPFRRIRNNQQLFDDILKSSIADSLTKDVYNNYIYMVAEKINHHKLKGLRDHQWSTQTINK